VRKDEIGFEKLGALPETTLGGAYARWMGSHHFDPDERYVDKKSELVRLSVLVHPLD
jgi:ubiquinone biosynthesis protein Coq4